MEGNTCLTIALLFCLIAKQEKRTLWLALETLAGLVWTILAVIDWIGAVL